MAGDLAENYARTKQSLKLFKNWLAKHPFIKFDGEDNIDEILLLYIRIRKYVMDRAYDSFQFCITYMKSHAEWYDDMGPIDYEYTREPDSPFLFLKNPDEQGRKIWIIRVKYFKDFDRFFRTIFLTPVLLIFEKEIQVNGIVVIFDLRDVDINKFKKIPLNLIYDSIKMTRNGSIRPKQINIIGMPSFVRPIFEFGKSFTSAKILGRINLLQNVEELSKVMNVKFLPKEYGGTSNELVDFEEFKKGMVYVEILNKFQVNFSKIQEFEGVGSFRKLEID